MLLINPLLTAIDEQILNVGWVSGRDRIMRSSLLRDSWNILCNPHYMYNLSCLIMWNPKYILTKDFNKKVKIENINFIGYFQRLSINTENSGWSENRKGIFILRLTYVNVLLFLLSNSLLNGYTRVWLSIHLLMDICVSHRFWLL